MFEDARDQEWQGDFEIHVVTAESAARRALALSLVVSRGVFEFMIANTPPAEREPAIRAFDDAHRDIYGGLREMRLWDGLAASEREWLDKPFGDWTARDVVDATWRGEALLVVKWALGRADRIPPYDEPPTPSPNEPLEITEIDLTMDATAEFHLRPEEEIATARDQAELWLWRARAMQVRREGIAIELPEGMSLDQIIALSAERGESAGWFRTIEGDLPAFQKPYAALNEEQWLTMYSIAMERLHALNWLCGLADDWDEVPLDT
jgi:hypothetical protein